MSDNEMILEVETEKWTEELVEEEEEEEEEE
eukprot:CAMPEP_0201486202 /NCGR_PEP_ID=MMETSP0151_2-20130828/10257_1 /ASSEMBLY_ACC=CAM_ASM_000257 /TAXON_ID=200890 /ORGANISM="Paramoeba atlantica, Strain 621/1 / CCAP 1560/9" /LENGTH=30 /DNA_ID= /DNA_START= /DNA_END= /DNA_ORIENTATION=